LRNGTMFLIQCCHALLVRYH